MKKRAVSLIMSAALCLLNIGSAFSAGTFAAGAQDDLWDGVYPVPEGERIPDAPAVTTVLPESSTPSYVKDPSQVVTDATGGGTVGQYDDRPSVTADPSETYVPQNAGIHNDRQPCCIGTAQDGGIRQGRRKGL